MRPVPSHHDADPTEGDAPLISAALGNVPVDLLLTNVRLANVFTSEIYAADIAIRGGSIAAVEGPGTLPRRVARETP